jgi:hypothetical protein
MRNCFTVKGEGWLIRCQPWHSPKDSHTFKRLDSTILWKKVGLEDLSTSPGGAGKAATPGRGGQGVVYRARHRSLGRLVALKTVPPTHLAGARARERFYLEARTASHLDHPNIVPIYEVGDRHGFCFYSMKLVEGTTMQRR